MYDGGALVIHQKSHFATSNATCLTKQTDTDIQVVARSTTQVVPTKLNQYLPRADSQETNEQNRTHVMFNSPYCHTHTQINAHRQCAICMA